MTDRSRISETRALRVAEEIVARAFPSGWSAKVVRAPGRSSGPRGIALRLRSADGDAVDFDLEVRRSLSPLDAVQLLDGHGIEKIAAVRPAPRPLVVVAPYLGERARDVIASRGVSYVDTTGNVRLQSNRPALFIMTPGATKDPWSDDQPLKSLRGRGAGRALRAVVDFRPPYGVRELAERTDVSPATLTRVIDLLARDALLTRNQRGRVTDVDWVGCVRRWSEDYEFTRSNRTTSFLAARGLTAVTASLGKVRWRYALTGSLAAQSFPAPIAPARLGMLYVDDVDAAVRSLDLREVDEGANVLIAEPFDPVVYERVSTRDHLTVAAPTQVAADLLTGPGRMPSEGEELIAWMNGNERVWRS